MLLISWTVEQMRRSAFKANARDPMAVLLEAAAEDIKLIDCLGPEDLCYDPTSADGLKPVSMPAESHDHMAASIASTTHTFYQCDSGAPDSFVLAIRWSSAPECSITLAHTYQKVLKTTLGCNAAASTWAETAFQVSGCCTTSSLWSGTASASL